MCEQVNSGLPENQRPRCENCTKVPKISPECKYIVDIYQVLLTLSVDPWSGLVKYDLPLIRSLFDVFGIEDEGRELASALLLFMVKESTEIRLKKRREEKDREDAKRDRKKFREEIGRARK